MEECGEKGEGARRRGWEKREVRGAGDEEGRWRSGEKGEGGGQGRREKERDRDRDKVDGEDSSSRGPAEASEEAAAAVGKWEEKVGEGGGMIG